MATNDTKIMGIVGKGIGKTGIQFYCTQEAFFRQLPVVGRPGAIFEAWHAVHQRYGVTLLEAPLRALAAEPAAGAQPPSLALIAEMLLAALTAAALHVARAPDSTKSLDEALSAIDVMLRAITSSDSAVER